MRAYSGASKLVLENATRLEMKLCKEYRITLDYDGFNSLQYYCKNNEIQILSTDYFEKIEINVLVIDSYAEKFLHDLSEITSRKADYEEVNQYYHE